MTDLGRRDEAQRSSGRLRPFAHGSLSASRCQRYRNAAGIFASVGDTAALAQGNYFVGDAPEAIVETVAASRVASAASHGAVGPCVPDEVTLCLNDGRFGVQVQWQDFDGSSGDGMARTLTDDSGTFWFFQQQNLEMVIKVLDGTGLNGHHWVYYGSLSNVAFDLQVTDTQTGRIVTYQNEPGTFASVGDTLAFPEVAN